MDGSERARGRGWGCAVGAVFALMLSSAPALAAAESAPVREAHAPGPLVRPILALQREGIAMAAEARALVTMRRMAGVRLVPRPRVVVPTRAHTPEPVEPTEPAARPKHVQRHRKPRKTPEPTPVTSTFTAATFNVLGASHTVAGGNSAGFAAGARRMGGAVALLRSQRVDVVALQELQRPQAVSFVRRMGGAFQLVPGLGASNVAGQNSLAFRTSRFSLVTSQPHLYPYFGGRMLPYPWVLLRDRQSGAEFWFTSLHNPATTRTHPGQGGNRHRALMMQVADARRVTSGDVPLIMAGDMNDRGQYFCPMTGLTQMHAANGGSTSGPCLVPPGAGIDWLMGSPQVSWSGYRRIGTAGVSDHPLIVAQATVTAGPGSAG